MSERNKVTEVRSEQYEPDRERQIFTFKVTQLIWLLLGVLEGFLALRVLLKLIAANPGSPIAALIYSFTDLFLIPFKGLTATPASGGFVLELSTMIAMIIYGLIGWAIERLIWIIFSRPRGPVVELTETQSHENPPHHQEISR